MGLAEELMKQDNLTVSYIASKLGYSNYSYFTKVFKKYTGKTPTEYKKELAKY
jgi:two-component system response regulator YesN